jgi:light-harvesting complex 1 beta chain
MAETNNFALQQILKRDSKVYLGIFAISFLVFLLVAVIAQATTCHWRTWLPGAEGEKSLISGVKGAVYTFMSNVI